MVENEELAALEHWSVPMLFTFSYGRTIIFLSRNFNPHSCLSFPKRVNRKVYPLIQETQEGV